MTPPVHSTSERLNRLLRPSGVEERIGLFVLAAAIVLAVGGTLF